MRIEEVDKLVEPLGWEYNEDLNVFVLINPMIELVEKED